MKKQTAGGVLAGQRLAFTLIELLVVIAIIAILAAMLLPDNSPSGWANTLTVSGYAGYTISDVNVTLNLERGWNGDLYGYLVHDSGLAVLVNRVGVDGSSANGYGNAGMNVTLDDAGASDIHNVGASGFVSGTYQPDGGANLAALNGAGKVGLVGGLGSTG